MTRPGTNRKNLVIVRAGNSSLHPEWLEGPGSEARSWDIIVNYFGDDPDMYRTGDTVRIDSKGPKWPALYELIEANLDSIGRYDNVWLPDDDLRCTCAGVNRLFEIFKREKLDLAQPSLQHGSYVSHLATMHNGSFRLRLTNFVEVMAPCFTRESLKKLLPTFNANLSGWGLDYVWPKLLGPEARIAIVDEVQILHTRPIGAANYAAMKERGVTAWDEMTQLLEKYGVSKRGVVIREGIASGSGKVIPHGAGLLFRYGAGLLPAAAEFKAGRMGFVQGWISAMKHQLLN